MYRALYRKWRPQRFQDVVGQRATVTALKNQVRTGRVGHAYLFTGVRGTGKTSCAKIFARAVNCLHPENGDPCCRCEICRGIENGSILDVVEMDAASNNGVDDIRELRDETAYTPSACQYKVYIIDEVHMLSAAAFNALLKTLEEPPAHVIFILATTEIQKVPATILSRCQRYDFTRIGPEDIAERVSHVAAEEGLELTPGGAALVARLADGAMRDALSILDTCAGVTSRVDETVVRRMAGVTDRSYLFRISDAVAAQDAAAALAELASLRQQSVDVKRLSEELIAHYRSLMLACLPGGRELLSGVSPEEEVLYLQKGPVIGQSESIRAIRALGSALEHMTRGSDQRIELELALFALTEPARQQFVPAAQPAAQPQRAAAAEPAAPKPFTAAAFSTQPTQKVENTQPVQEAAPLPWDEPQPAPKQTQPAQETAGRDAAEELPPPPDLPPEQSAAAPQSSAEDIPLPEPPPEQELPPPAEELTTARPARTERKTTPARRPAAESAAPSSQTYAADPTPRTKRNVAETGINPYPQWSEVLKKLQDTDLMLYGYLRRSKAYFDGTRVLIDGGKTFRDFIRVNKDSQRMIKKVIQEVSGLAVPIGPYEPRKKQQGPATSAEQSLQALQKLGLEVEVHDNERVPRK